MSLFFYIASFLLGAVGALAIKSFALKLGFIDHPKDRSSHIYPTPKGGGIGILAAFIFSSLFLNIPYSFLVPASFLALFSLVGDRFDISPKIRLPIQLIIAQILVYFAGPGFQSCIFLFIFFTIFIVSTANWYNFMDGINGIASITGIVAFGFLSYFAAISKSGSNISVFAICIACSCLGFLPFNMPKAKVFMGDVGSILLGFSFAAMAAMIARSLMDFVCLASFLFPFYADEWTTMSIRLKNGENILKPHRNHFYQILANEWAIDHWKISAGYGFFQILVGTCVLQARPYGLGPVAAILLISFSGFILANCFIRKKISFLKP